jgi:tetratricopeptide (TPR) repeat protein
VSVRLKTLALVAGGLAGLSAAGQPPAAAPTTTPSTQDAPKPPAPTPLPPKAIELFQKRDFDGCLEELRKAAATNPMAPQPRVQLANLFFEVRDGKAARTMLELAAKEDPKHPDVYLTNASFAFGEGRITDAILNLTVALREALDNPRWNADQRNRFTRDARIGLAACYETRGSWAEAKEHVTALYDADKKNSAYLVRLGAIEFQLGNAAAALDAFTKAHKDDPTIDPPELKMGMLWFGKNDPKTTEDWLKKAEAAHPKEPKVYRGYTEFLLNETRFSEADAKLKKAEELAPTARDTLYLRGLYYRYTKKFGEAEKVFDDLSRRYPADIPVTVNLALSLAESTDKVRQQRGVDYAESVVRQASQNPEGYAALGWCYFKIGRLDDAEKALGTAAQGRQLSLDAAFYLARLLATRGKEEEAYKIVKTAVNEKGPFVYRDEAKALFDTLDKKLPKEKKEDKPAEKK